MAIIYNVPKNTEIIDLNLNALILLSTKTAPSTKKRKLDDAKQAPPRETLKGASPPTDLRRFVTLADRRLQFTTLFPEDLDVSKVEKLPKDSDGNHSVSTSTLTLKYDSDKQLVRVMARQALFRYLKLLFAFKYVENGIDFNSEFYLSDLTPSKRVKSGITDSSSFTVSFNIPQKEMFVDIAYKLSINFSLWAPLPPDIIDRINLLVDQRYTVISKNQPTNLPGSSVNPHFFYSQVASHTESLPTIDLPFHVPNFNLSLLKFQKKTVNWLLNKESMVYDTNSCEYIHKPAIDLNLVEKLKAFIDSDESIDTNTLDDTIHTVLNQLCFGWDIMDNGEINLFYNRYTGGIVTRFSVCAQLIEYYNNSQEKGILSLPAQGLLAEEMGLGKTVEITALSLLNPRPSKDVNAIVRLEHGSSTKAIIKAKTTLVISPDSILKQWVLEVESMAPSLLVTIYKGFGNYPKLDNNPALVSEYLRKFDMVFTTYSIISKELDYALYSSRSRDTRNSARRNVNYTDYLEGSPSFITDSVGSESGSDEIVSYASLETSTERGKRANGKFGETDFERKLQEDMALAIETNKIPEIFKGFDYESPLMLTQFWRVVLDEVQMVSSKYSRAFKSAALIPRFHAWGVSGTPIKKDLSDLNSILSFLNYFPFTGALGRRSWLRLLSSSSEFIKLWRNLAIRHTKALVQEDINLPPQTRILLTVPFSAVEQDMYDRALESCLEAVCLDYNGNPAIDDWEPSPSIMSLMKHGLMKLRQLCNNQQIGELAVSARKQKNTYLYLSVDERLKTLQSLLDNNLAAALSNVLNLERSFNQILCNLGDFFQFIYLPELALEVLTVGGRETEKIIHRSNKLVQQYLKEQQALTLDIKQLSSNDESSSETDYNKLELLNEKIKSMNVKIRNWKLSLHKYYFLLASGNFQRYDEEYGKLIKLRGVKGWDSLLRNGTIASLKSRMEEKSSSISNLVGIEPKHKVPLSCIREISADSDTNTFQKLELFYYASAEALRRDLLQAAIDSVSVAVFKKISKTDVVANSEVCLNDHGYRLYDSLSNHVFYRVPKIASEGILLDEGHAASEIQLFKLIEELNRQAEVVNTWVTELLKILASPLLSPDNDPNGEEYDQTIQDQGKAQCYLNFLDIILNARSESINGSENLRKYIKFAEQGSNLQNEDDSFAGELSATLKQSQITTELSLNQILEELNIHAKHYSNLTDFERLEIIHKNQKKALSDIRKELKNNLNFVFNARVEFFKQLQQISDTVQTGEYGIDRNNLEGEVVALEVLKKVKTFDLTDKKLDQSIGRYRYLQTLVSESSTKSDQTMCIICRSNITLGSLTQCGHKYCKDCLEQWLKTSHTCPMCKATVVISTMHHFTCNVPNLKAQVYDEGAGSKGNLNLIYKSLPDDVLDSIQSIELKSSYSSKVDTIVKQVLHLKSKDPSVQIVIFSQWQDMLYILATALKAADITFLGSYGILNEFGGGRRHKMLDSIEDFKDPSRLITCFLLNAKAQSSGLTLVNASHVFLCEPLVNVSLELQAISRIHRIGQTKPTTIWMFAIENTVEENILLVSTNKRLLLAKELNKDTSSEDNSERIVALGEKELSEAESTSLMTSGGIENMVNKNLIHGEAVMNSDLWACLFSAGNQKIAGAKK